MSKKILFAVCMGFFIGSAFAQKSRSLPFLEINPDVRTAGMGDVSVAESSGTFLYSNPTSFLSKTDNKMYGAYTYGIYPKIDGHNRMFHAVSAGYRFLEHHALMVGFRYFRENPIRKVGNDGIERKEIKPKDWSIDFAYALSFNENWSAYIGGSFIQSYISKTAYTGVGSIGMTYRNAVNVCGRNSQYLVGLSLNDVGGKIKYGKKGYSADVPTSVKLGGSIEFPINDQHHLAFALDTRYFMLPSDADAFTGGVGLEYKFLNMASFRTGYHWGDGNGYATLGAGYRVKSCELNVAYNIAKDSDFNFLRLGLSINL